MGLQRARATQLLAAEPALLCEPASLPAREQGEPQVPAQRAAAAWGISRPHYSMGKPGPGALRVEAMCSLNAWVACSKEPSKKALLAALRHKS